MGLIDDLRDAPRRKASAKRAAQDRDIFRAARDAHHQRMADRATETDEDRDPMREVDWRVDLEDSQ